MPAPPARRTVAGDGSADRVAEERRYHRSRPSQSRSAWNRRSEAATRAVPVMPRPARSTQSARRPARPDLPADAFEAGLAVAYAP